MSDESEPLKIPIDGILDLHTFRPQDVKNLVPEYLIACQERGILQVRIIHGKGSGILRHIVHSILAKLPIVQSFATADISSGSWGATIVYLKQNH
jgi:DNA-nicking Smr family endonuclease